MKKSLLDFVPFILWIILVFVLLVMPASAVGEVDVSIPYADKLVHAFIFGMLVMLFGWAYRKEPFRKNSIQIFIVAIAACFYGIAMEYVQRAGWFSPRDFDVWDMVADCVGALSGFLIIRALILSMNKKDMAKREKFS